MPLDFIKTIKIKNALQNLLVSVCVENRTKPWILLLHGLQSSQKMYDEFK